MLKLTSDVMRLGAGRCVQSATMKFYSPTLLCSKASLHTSTLSSTASPQIVLTEAVTDRVY
jgi:hypothetical protein